MDEIDNRMHQMRMWLEIVEKAHAAHESICDYAIKTTLVKLVEHAVKKELADVEANASGSGTAS